MTKQVRRRIHFDGRVDGDTVGTTTFYIAPTNKQTYLQQIITTHAISVDKVRRPTTAGHVRAAGRVSPAGGAARHTPPRTCTPHTTHHLHPFVVFFLFFHKLS